MLPLLPWSYATEANLTLRGWHSQPSGKPVLHFLHGNGLCGLVYSPMLQALSEHFDLWLCDIQGHGASDAGEQFLGWNCNADLAMAAFDAHASLWQGVAHYALGHSFGGVLTSLLLAKHPQRFRAAVLLDPVIFTPWMVRALQLGEQLGLQHFTPLAKQAKARRRSWANRGAAAEALNGRGMFREWAPEAFDAYIQHALQHDEGGEARLRCPAEIEATIFSTTPRGLWSALRVIAVPTCLIHGERSYPFVAKSVKRLQGLNQTIVVQQVAGGHCFMQESPTEAADWVSTFLRSQSV